MKSGDLVVHHIFGKGVATDDVKINHSDKEYNRVCILFEEEGRNWLIAAPGYLSGISYY